MTERSFFETEMLRITEAFCVDSNIPIRRRFTDAELEQSIERVREAAVMVERFKERQS